jgi:quercetin dioxygenase-like cupin family protein
MSGYNPDFDPTGIEGGVDTNTLPWIEIAQAPGMAFKPLRASNESGMFSSVVKFAAGADLGSMVHLGAADLMVLSGRMRYTQEPLAGVVEPGVWGYIPANTRVEGLVVEEDTELLMNFYGPVAFVDSSSSAVTSVLTSLDVQLAARSGGIALVPNTLAECMQPRPQVAAAPGVPLAIAGGDAGKLVDEAGVAAIDSGSSHPHFVDTRAIPWLSDPALPEIALKIMRVSEETGTTSLIVRHNGVAGPHYHLGAADFLILSGHLGYRAGPPEGYGPGVWFYEPAGARHDATQRVGDDVDLIYTANVYGPVQFDEGRDTPIVAVQSWMQYKAAAEAIGTPLVANVFEDDASLLAWSPLGSADVAVAG